jgi:hypothetical protein
VVSVSPRLSGTRSRRRLASVRLTAITEVVVITGVLYIRTRKVFPRSSTGLHPILDVGHRKARNTNALKWQRAIGGTPRTRPNHITRTASNLAVHIACVLHLCFAAVSLPGQLPSSGVAGITVGFARLSVMQLAGLCTRAVSCRLPVPCIRSCGAHLLVAVLVCGVPRVAGFGVVTVLVGGARAAPAGLTVTGGVPWWTVGYVLAGRAGRQVVVPCTVVTCGLAHTVGLLAHPPPIIAGKFDLISGEIRVPTPTQDTAMLRSTGTARNWFAGQPEAVPPNAAAPLTFAFGRCCFLAGPIARLARRCAFGAERVLRTRHVCVLCRGLATTRRPLVASLVVLPARCATACVGPPVRGARAAVLAWVVVASFRVLTCWARPAALAAAGVATSVGDAAAVAAIRAVVAPCRVVTALAGRMTPAALAGAAVVAPVGDAAAVPAVGVAVAAGRVAAGIT